MSDIRKRTNSKGTSYQVRYADRASGGGFSYKSFATRKEAQSFVESGSARKRSGINSDVRTVEEAVNRWLDICEKIGRDGREKVEPETLVEYKRRAAVMLAYPWQKRLQDLQDSDVVRFRNWLLENKSRDLARRTLSSFHSVIIEMKRQGHVDGDCAAGIAIRSDGRYDEDGEVEIPSDQEVSDLLAAIDDIAGKSDFMEERWARYRPLIYLAVFSGMRPSEYRGLSWPSISDGRIEVRQRADKNGRIGPVKSKAGRRSLIVPTLVTDLIFEWKDRCAASRLDLVFPTETGRPIAHNNFVRRCWNPLLREAGLVVAEMEEGIEVQRAKYGPYCLRHYVASKLIEKNKDAKYIQKFMGHSDIKFTLNVYGHLMKEREDLHRQTADEMASDLIPGLRNAKACGVAVAQAN